jgi:CYTH domain-containing protein
MKAALVVADNFIEIERKFLISNVDPSMLPDHRETIIEQTSLLSRDGNLDRRIRKENCRGETRYYLVEKYLTSKPSIGFKRKEQIGKRRFERLKISKDPNVENVRKIRWEFLWNSNRFRIDKYDGPVAGLLILEAVLHNENDKVALPGFCEVIREVTGDTQYYWHRADKALGKSETALNAKKNKASFYIVALVDLLGQGAALERFAGIPKTVKDKKTFSRIAQETFGTVERFRERIRLLNHAEPRFHGVPDQLRLKLNAAQLRIVERSLEPVIGYQFFTDLAMLKINLGGQKGYRPLASLYGLLRQLGLLILTQFAEGILIRGAVDVGICAELNEADLYGQAVGRAYKLESQVAIYPRIVIGKHVVDYLASFAGLRSSENEKGLIHSYTDLVNSCLRQDMDGVTVLSYLDPFFRRSYFEDEDSLRYVLRSACRNIQRQSNLCTQEDVRLRGRLEEVEGYFRHEGCWIDNK